MTECPDPIQIEALVDGEMVQNEEALVAHIATCETCTRIKRDTEELNRLVRGTVAHYPVPPLRRDWPAPLPGTAAHAETGARRRYSRRALLAGGGALAASVAGLAFALRPGQDIVPIDHLMTTYFGDFETLIAAERRLDITESDPSHLRDWFGSRVPFDMPAIALREGLSLRGGRLCWLLERRNAALYFDTPDGPCCLYLASSKSLDTVDPDAPVLRKRGELSGAFWQAGDVMHALIGELSDTAFTALARSFTPAIPPLFQGDAR